MKYAVILNGDQNAPHLKIYTNILDEKNISYDVISWDRSGRFGKSEFTYNAKSDLKQNSLMKLMSYVKFASFIKKLIKKFRYDKLIIISPQVALFMPFFLRSNYRKNYIFDYRDLSIEQMPIFKPFMKMVLKNSYANIISSPGFKQYLPQGFDYILSHNFNIDLVKQALAGEPSYFDASPIKILTIGGIRIDANYEVIDSLANKDYIELSFIGKGDAAPIFEEYCKQKDIKNVTFKGFYTKDEEGDIIKKHTMINIFYPKIPSHITALSNRFYNSLIFKRPMIVTKGGIQGMYAEKYGVGLAVENCDHLSENLNDYLCHLDFNDYVQNCNKLLSQFVDDYNVFRKAIDVFLSNK